MDFCTLQNKIGIESVVLKRFPNQDRTLEQLNKILTEFKNAFIPSFLQNGQIYEKLFHENLTDEHWSMITQTFDFMNQVHQTFSTNKIMAQSNMTDCKHKNLLRNVGSKSKESNKRVKKIEEKEISVASPSSSSYDQMKDCKQIQLIPNKKKSDKIEQNSKQYMEFLRSQGMVSHRDPRAHKDHMKRSYHQRDIAEMYQNLSGLSHSKQDLSLLQKYQYRMMRNPINSGIFQGTTIASP